MGSPDFSIPTLQALAKNYQIVGVITQPGKPAGRGQILKHPPVKIWADELNIPVIQPHRLKEGCTMIQLHLWQPDLIVVAAFGQILRPDVLNLPVHGCINVHASLLPRWRGAAPITAAILNGDEQTGISIMKMDPGLDTGDILSQRSIDIEDNDTTGLLNEKLSQLGAELLMGTLPDYLDDKLLPLPQNNALATFAPKIEKSVGELDFSQNAIELSRRVRAFNPWPGAYMFWHGSFVKIHQAQAVNKPSPGIGKHTIIKNMPAIGTGVGILSLTLIQPSGKKSMPGDVFLRGAKDWLES